MSKFESFSKSLQSVLNDIEKVQGNEVLLNLEDVNLNYPKKASWGSITLDIASGGGTPEGRNVEIYGWESTGKTTIAIHAAVEVQKKGYPIAIVDMEHALDYGYCQSLGLDLKRAIIAQPDSGEKALDIVEMLTSSGEVGLIVLDSLAALVPEAELEGKSGDLKVGLVARLVSQHFRKNTPIAKKNGTTIIYINQFREKINTGFAFGDNKTLAAGNATKYYCSQRLEVKRVGRIDVGDKEYVGNEIEVEFKKNKLSPPFKKAYFTIVYGKGISKESEILNACFDLGLIVKTGSGPAPGFETPVWEGAIESTEAKVIDALGTEEYKDLYFELSKRLELAIGNITQEEFDEIINPLHSSYNDKKEEFGVYMERSNFWSGKSKYFESKFYAERALKIFPLNKVAQKKLIQMDAKIKEKLYSFKGEIEVDDYLLHVSFGVINDVEVLTKK